VLKGLNSENEIFNSEDEKTKLTKDLVRLHSFCYCRLEDRSHWASGMRWTRYQKYDKYLNVRKGLVLVLSSEKTQAEGDTTVGLIRVLSVVL
jgi:hypothetical protein